MKTLKNKNQNKILKLKIINNNNNNKKIKQQKKL